ncbi:chemotaxis protein CheW [Candidatus Woesearchaeota archaeon]|nr:chemotaxis protein CheW [Candidatus Woesearchaeota archaeon]
MYEQQEEHKKSLDERQLVIFRLGDEEFGVNISEVREIIRMEEITKIPNTSPYIKGVINLRGGIIVVIDLAMKIGLKSKSADNNTRIIVIEVDESTVGMIVDSATEVIRLNSDQIQPAPQMITQKINSDYIEGVGVIKERLLILLDLVKVLKADDFKVIQQVAMAENKPDDNNQSGGQADQPQAENAAQPAEQPSDSVPSGQPPSEEQQSSGSEQPSGQPQASGEQPQPDYPAPAMGQQPYDQAQAMGQETSQPSPEQAPEQPVQEGQPPDSQPSLDQPGDSRPQPDASSPAPSDQPGEQPSASQPSDQPAPAEQQPVQQPAEQTQPGGDTATVQQPTGEQSQPQGDQPQPEQPAQPQAEQQQGDQPQEEQQEEPSQPNPEQQTAEGQA